MVNISFQTQGYFLEYLNTRGKEGHIFCGDHQIKGGICPNCSKPLLRFFTLNLDDKRLHIRLNGIKQLHLVFCWRCNIAQGDLFYKLIADDEIQLVKFREGIVPDYSYYEEMAPESEKDEVRQYIEELKAEQDLFPYEDYPHFFPQSSVVLEPLSQEIQDRIRYLNSGGPEEESVNEELTRSCGRPRHQIGGEPYFVQGELRRMICPECGDSLPLLAAVADDCLDVRGFVDNAFVQVIYVLCVKCRIIGVYQECD